MPTKNPAKLLRAILISTGLDQLRNVPKNWLYRLREPEPRRRGTAHDDSPAWDLLEKLKKTDRDDLAALDKEIAGGNHAQPARSAPKNGACLHPCFLRRAIPDRPLAMFREAAAITPYISPGLNEYLQGRLHEEMGQLTEAAALLCRCFARHAAMEGHSLQGIVCRVKMGFAEQVLGQVVSMVNSDPEYFNRFD